MLDPTDPFRLKKVFDLLTVLRQELGSPADDLRFLRSLRRALLPLPGVDRARPRDSAIFPPLTVKPHPVLAGKRVGLVASGGSGALVTLCGVKRALEEAGVELAAVSVCSGSAIWGSMIAAGFTAQQMVDLSLSWTLRDLLETDWKALAKLPLPTAGFSGFLRGDPLERTLNQAFGGATLAQAKIPYHAIVLDIDRNRVEYFGPDNHPDVPLARMAHVAIALPLFVQPVRFGEHLYVDGGVVNVFPVEPLLQHERPYDHILGVNVIMPSGFDGEDVTGWDSRPGSIFKAMRQLYHAQWLELARQAMDRVRDKMLLLEPLPYTEIAGTRFYEILIDGTRWPEHILAAYRHTKDRLEELR